MDPNPELTPMFSQAIPVLAVGNVSKTITYWTDILGFPSHWAWGDPVSHGGVDWHGASLQFMLDPELAARSIGNSVFMRVRNLDALYRQHIGKKAEIVSTLADREYGMADYAIRDINGYYIVFAAQIAARSDAGSQPKANIRLIRRKPSIAEYRELFMAVGWSGGTPEDILALQFQTSVLAVLAEDVDTGEIVGCVFLYGDGVGFYYVKDMVVKPALQGQGIGSRLMENIMDWVQAHAPDYATIGLFTGDHLAPFYKKFGFMQANGMYQQIIRKPDGDMS